MPPKPAPNQKRPRTTTFHPAAKRGSSSSGPVATSSSSRPAATIATSSSRAPVFPSSSPATAIASPSSVGTVVDEEVPRKEADDEKLWLRDNGATYPTLQLLGNCVEQFRSAYNNAERILHRCEAYVAAVAFQAATDAPTQLFTFVDSENPWRAFLAEYRPLLKTVRFLMFDGFQPELPSLPHEWTATTEQVLTPQKKDIAVNVLGALSDCVNHKPFQLVSRSGVAKVLASLRKPPPVPLRPIPQDNIAPASGCGSHPPKPHCTTGGLPWCQSWSA